MSQSVAYDIDDIDEDDMDCLHCGGNHSSIFCSELKRFDDMDCFKCGETFFFRTGECSSCGNKQY